MNIKYISYYNKLNERAIYPASVNKIGYILSTLEKIDCRINVISLSSSIKKYLPKTTIVLSENIKLHYFTSLCKNNFFFRVISSIYLYFQLILFILIQVHKGETILVYHSLGYSRIIFWLKYIKNFKLVLEMEEIYSDVICNNKTRKLELALANIADGYIFPTQLLDNLINKNNKPSVIVHGTYQIQPTISQQKMFDNDKIHVVYAGTLDPRKGGAVAAATAAAFLPPNYHIHILGFGSNNQVENIKYEVEKLKSLKHAKVSYDGCLSGMEYIKFIQSCQIGLSTQDPSAMFNNTSFPSKILSYMANGLRVVSIRIPVIEQSAIYDLITYYDNQTPQEIAKAIISVDISNDYDSRERLQELDNQFQKDLQQLLQNI